MGTQVVARAATTGRIALKRNVVACTAIAVIGAAAALVGLTASDDRPPDANVDVTALPAVPAQTATRIAVAGDTGTGPGSAIEQTVEVMTKQDRQRRYDGLILLGDLIYPEGDSDQARSRITDVFAPLLSQGTRLLPVLGNHDYMSGEQAAILTTTERDTSWYVDTVGVVRVVVLDTERIDNPAQTTWLAETLASPTDAAWTIVVMHKPAFSAGFHGSDENIQQQWVPLFEQYDVPLVLAGHDHDYQRSGPINGVTYIVTGGAATLRDAGHADFTRVSVSTRHYVDLLANHDRLTVRAIDQDGMLIDSVELTR